MDRAGSTPKQAALAEGTPRSRSILGAGAGGLSIQTQPEPSTPGAAVGSAGPAQRSSRTPRSTPRSIDRPWRETVSAARILGWRALQWQLLMRARRRAHPASLTTTTTTTHHFSTPPIPAYKNMVLFSPRATRRAAAARRAAARRRRCRRARLQAQRAAPPPRRRPCRRCC